MPKGEIQNRDRDESQDLSGVPLAGGSRLGELPEDLANERGDMDTYALKAAEQMAPDMASAQRGRVDAALTGVGSPKIDYSVRSVFDSRPVNAIEFNLWFGVEWPSAPDFADFSALVQSFYVPAGYVACLRRVDIVAEVDGNSMTPYDGTCEIMVNNAVMDPLQVPPGPVASNGSSASQEPGIVFLLPGSIDTFILADENLSVGVRLTFVDSGLLRPSLRVGFHGSFLLKTGVPAQFQAANEAGRARSAVTASRADLSSEGLMAKRRRKVPFPSVPLIHGPK